MTDFAAKVQMVFLLILIAAPFLVGGIRVALKASSTHDTRSVTGAAVLLVCALYSIYGALMIAGGPDARFREFPTVLLGITSTILAVFLALVACRLLMVKWYFAMSFLVPTFVVFVVRATQNTHLAVTLFFPLPILCALLIVILHFLRTDG
jgi:hypothetical protein